MGITLTPWIQYTGEGVWQLTLVIVFSAVRWVSLFGTVTIREIRWSISKKRFSTTTIGSHHTHTHRESTYRTDLPPVHKTYPAHRTSVCMCFGWRGHIIDLVTYLIPGSIILRKQFPFQSAVVEVTSRQGHRPYLVFCQLFMKEIAPYHTLRSYS